jgi:membrane protein YdbS with pleckstrin-like domain
MAEMEAPPAEESSGEETPTATVPETLPAAVPAGTGPAPVTRKRATRAQGDSAGQLVFRSRPSLVPALICFWLFLIGAILIGALLSQSPSVGLLLSAGLGLILEMIVLYAILRTLAVRYELTSQQLTLRFQGKRARVPISDIYNAEMKQSFLQRMIGIGDIDIDAAVNGQLAHLRMRNIPQCQLRAEQIMHLVKEHGPA